MKPNWIEMLIESGLIGANLEAVANFLYAQMVRKILKDFNRESGLNPSYHIHEKALERVLNSYKNMVMDIAKAIKEGREKRNAGKDSEFGFVKN